MLMAGDISEPNQEKDHTDRQLASSPGPSNGQNVLKASPGPSCIHH